MPHIPTLLRNFWGNARQDIRASWQTHPWRWFVVILLIVAIFIPRLSALGSILTIDEPLWESRGQQFIKGVSSFHFERTLVAGQPGITTAWLVGLSAPFQSLAAHQASIAVATGVLLLIITYFLTMLWGFRWGMIAAFVLALEPFLLGHSRVVHTDALLALFLLASFVSLLAALEPLTAQRTAIKRYIVLSAILFGLAALTKVFAIVVFPMYGLLFFYYIIRSKQKWSHFFQISLLWIGVLVVAIYIVWPALWLNADRVFDLLTERSTLHTEGTRSEETTSEQWYYIREGLFRITPFTMIFLPLGIIALFSSRYPRMRRTILFLLLTGLLYVGALSVGADKSDRYILFALLTFTLGAVYGLRVVLEFAPRAALAVPVVLVIVLTLNAARLHPYYLAYYNELYPIESDHKLGWGEGLEVAADWIHTNHPGAEVASYYPRVFDHFYPGPVSPFNHADNKDFMVLYRSMFERGPGAEETDVLNQYLGKAEPVHVVTINRLPYVWIYPIQSDHE